jgi:hypothetical protein
LHNLHSIKYFRTEPTPRNFGASGAFVAQKSQAAFLTLRWGAAF